MKTKRSRLIVAALGVSFVLTWSASYATEPLRILNSKKTLTPTTGALLRSAAFAGNVEDITRLLAKRADLNDRDSDGWTPLIWAQLGNRPKAVKLLLERGARVDDSDNAGYTALHHAAVAGRDNVMALLVQYGAKVDTRSRDGSTALADAAAYGRVEAAGLLLSAGADPNATTTDGDTPLSLAQRNHNPGMVMLLLAKGATPDPQRARLRTALRNLHEGSGDPALVHVVRQITNHQVLETVCSTGGSSAPSRAKSGPMRASNVTLAAWCQAAGSGSPAERTTDGTYRPQGGADYGSTRAVVRDRPDNPPHAVREALDLWGRIQAKYPEVDKPIRDASRKSSSLESLAAREPLLEQALSMWQRLRVEHPDLAAQLLSLAGMGR